MKLEEAIKTAIDYESTIRNLYADAVERVNHPDGRKFFMAMVSDEQRHLDYLNEKLEQWEKDGKVTVDLLKTAIPSLSVIADSLNNVSENLSELENKDEIVLLEKALNMEMKTSNFYKEFIGKLDGEGQAMFKRFAEIEEGHVAVVRAEIDSLTKSGFWLDFLELDLED